MFLCSELHQLRKQSLATLRQHSETNKPWKIFTSPYSQLACFGVHVELVGSKRFPILLASPSVEISEGCLRH